MNNGPGTQHVNVNQLSSKFKSKKELYQFLVQDCQAYLPPLNSTNIYFFKGIMRGDKDYVLRDKVLVASVPQIEGLTVEDILAMFSGNARLLRHIPDERDWVHIDRKWLQDILFTLERAGFQSSITAAMKRRRDKVEQSRNLMVDMRPEFAQALQSCLNFSNENGRSVHLLKSSSKRKRTRAELDDMKAEEEELKEDRQIFLQQVKRLKQERAELEDELIQVRNESMLGGAFMQANRPSSQGQVFYI